MTDPHALPPLRDRGRSLARSHIHNRRQRLLLRAGGAIIAVNERKNCATFEKFIVSVDLAVQRRSSSAP